jgi:hypothetical protein
MANLLKPNNFEKNRESRSANETSCEKEFRKKGDLPTPSSGNTLSPPFEDLWAAREWIAAVTNTIRFILCQ